MCLFFTYSGKELKEKVEATGFFRDFQTKLGLRRGPIRMCRQGAGACGRAAAHPGFSVMAITHLRAIQHGACEALRARLGWR